MFVEKVMMWQNWNHLFNNVELGFWELYSGVILGILGDLNRLITDSDYMITFCSHVWWILRAHEELFANGVLNNLVDFCLPYGELDVCLVHNTVIQKSPTWWSWWQCVHYLLILFCVFFLSMWERSMVNVKVLILIRSWSPESGNGWGCR